MDENGHSPTSGIGTKQTLNSLRQKVFGQRKILPPISENSFIFLELVG
jgi:hypothetical protein